MPRKTIEQRFWEKVDKNGLIHPELGTPCWKWKACKIKGYGSIGELAHRVSWKIHNGSIPDSMKVLHRCDNPECTNPDHLFLGSQFDNVHDMIKKGRQKYKPAQGASHGSKTKPESIRRGTSHVSRKLTAEEVVEIRFFHKNLGVSQVRLSQMFEVHRETIRNIVNRQTWKQLK